MSGRNPYLAGPFGQSQMNEVGRTGRRDPDPNKPTYEKNGCNGTQRHRRNQCLPGLQRMFQALH